METISVTDQLKEINIASKLDSGVLELISTQVSDGYDVDKNSRKEWLSRSDDYLKLASQIKETKNFPWEGAANVKLPLLSTASLQFAARAYQQLIPSQKVVKGRVVGKPDDEKRAKAERISKHMSFQLMEQMETWEDDMDRLCLVLPICGNVFKKTYRVPGKNVSELVLPQDLVVNYYAKSIEEASRKSHVLLYYDNELETAYRTGEFTEPENDLPPPSVSPSEQNEDKIKGQSQPDADGDSPHRLVEQHCFYDLDGDGYKEPVIVTFHEETGHIFRIVARYYAKDVEYGGNDGKVIVKIKPDEIFTNFIFIPHVSSGVYGQGFGTLIGPLNEASNSVVNQLIDAGTLGVLPAGFIGRGVRGAQGRLAFQPGEFKQVNSSGADLKNNIFMLPVKEPSNVMFNLLGLLMDAANQLSSVTDLMKGISPGQNQPYSTTSDLQQQGQQVFSSIYKRVHRSLKKEFKKLFLLNKLYVTDEEYFHVIDSDQEETGKIEKNDYKGEVEVIPASDPTVLTNQEKLLKAEALVGFVQLGTVNAQVATARTLEAQGQEGIKELMTMPPPQPNPEHVLKEKELAIREMEVMGGLQLTAEKNAHQAARDDASAALNIAKSQSEGAMVQIAAFEAEIKAAKAEADATIKSYETQMKAITEKYKADKSAEKTTSKEE